MVDMGKLDPDDSRPPSVQLADVLRAAITGGRYEPGAQLPSYSTLSTEFGVAPNTVKSALAALRAEGLIVSRQGKGSFVRTRRLTEDSESVSFPEIEKTLADLVRRLDAVESELRTLQERLPG